jgi:hypothetical protein
MTQLTLEMLEKLARTMPGKTTDQMTPQDWADYFNGPRKAAGQSLPCFVENDKVYIRRPEVPKKTVINVPPVLHYQKHRRGCPCLSCDELRETSRARRDSAISRALAWVLAIMFVLVIIDQLWIKFGGHP